MVLDFPVQGRKILQNIQSEAFCLESFKCDVNLSKHFYKLRTNIKLQHKTIFLHKYLHALAKLATAANELCSTCFKSISPLSYSQVWVEPTHFA